MRILVVDDDLIQQQTLACFLKTHGYDVETALTGLEAIRRVSNDHYHVVLMDHAMPEINGASAGKVIRRNRGDGGYPWLIALSANVNAVVQQEAMSGTVFDRLEQKPWHPPHLLELLKTCDRPVPSEAERARLLDEDTTFSHAVTETTIAWRYHGFFTTSTPAKEKMKVLLVDEDPALVADFTVSLTSLGYEVDHVPTRAAALERMATQPYDVVLADYLRRTRFCGSPAAYTEATAVPRVSPQPRAQPSGFEPGRKAAAPEQAAPAAGPLRVLVAEGSDLHRDVLASMLRAGGHQVTCVDSGPEAVAVALQNELDVVLMDLRMPLLSGLEASRQIRAGATVQACVPILALAGQVAEDQVVQWRGAGLDGYLSKPFAQDAVLAVVARAGAAKQRANAAADPAVRALAQSLLTVSGSEFSTLDQDVFNQTKHYLGEQKATSYVEVLATKTQSLLGKLANKAPAELVEETHALGGSAGMFGFTRLLEVSRLFEHAVKSETADIASHVRGLQAALEVTRDELGRRMGAGAGVHGPAIRRPADGGDHPPALH